MSKVYVIATAHDAYRQREFEPGDIVIDPWRMIPDQKDVTVKRLGENRPALISVLVPTRGRPAMFSRMYDSLMATVTYPRQVEVVVWIDDDDPFLWEYASRPVGEAENITYLQGERQLLSQCWNDCAGVARGEILMHGGDDITFDTPGWDVMVRQAFDESDDKILLVQGDDLSPNREVLATHGFLHRRWVETVGYFLPPLFSCDWNDVWLTEVADAIGRRKILPFVTAHHHYSFEMRDRDETDREREERGVSDDVVALFKRTRPHRVADAKKLRKVMA